MLHKIRNPPARAGLKSFSGPLPADLLRLAERVARSMALVLIHGETGAGKTYLARLIHELSPRAGGRFEHVNCASIPESLFESELFGHVKGAFTGASETRSGFFEAARGGTLFLDEIGELPLALQPKLLSALEDGYIRRVGTTRETLTDVRFIAATNRDLSRMIQRKEFREDLFHRLAVFELRVPPLRERPKQFSAILQHLLRRRAAGGAPLEVSPAAMQLLRTYSWPGNIRELDNALLYAATLAEEGIIEPEHLPERIRASRSPWYANGSHQEARCSPRYAAPGDAEEEREQIVAALQAENGNRKRAAKRLGMSRSALYTKLYRYGLLSGHSSSDASAMNG